jgi:hypothetical protein
MAKAMSSLLMLAGLVVFAISFYSAHLHKEIAFGIHSVLAIVGLLLSVGGFTMGVNFQPISRVDYHRTRSYEEYTYSHADFLSFNHRGRVLNSGGSMPSSAQPSTAARKSAEITELD